MIYHVTCSTDDNYIQHCLTMLCSLLENNRKQRLIIHLLHCGLNNISQSLLKELVIHYNAEIIFYEVETSILGSVKIADNHPDLSIATYFRILLPSLLNQSIDKILYLDCDVIVLKDLSALFTIELDEYGVAGVKDPTPQTDCHRNIMGLSLEQNAFCAGVLMINLKYWREHDSQQQMLKFAKENSNKLVMEDQDVLNHEFRSHWFQLPYKYGKTPLSICPMDSSQKYLDYYEYLYDPAIIHYAAKMKPWLDVWFPEKYFYWKYLRKSGFINPLVVKTDFKYKLQVALNVFRYLINKYLRPCIPDFIEIILKDIYNIIAFLLSLFTPEKRKSFILRRWLGKYNIN